MTPIEQCVWYFIYFSVYFLLVCYNVSHYDTGLNSRQNYIYALVVTGYVLIFWNERFIIFLKGVFTNLFKLKNTNSMFLNVMVYSVLLSFTFFGTIVINDYYHNKNDPVPINKT